MKLSPTLFALATATGLAAAASMQKTPEIALIHQRTDTLAVMVAALDSVRGLGQRLREVWPGFSLEDQVLIMTAPSGYTLISGSVDTAGGFVPVRGSRSLPLVIRRGAPADSLTGLRIHGTWQGKPATALGYSPIPLVRGIVHESFHTYQRLLKGQFPGGRTPQFPDTSLEALALINLEARYLAEGLSKQVTAPVAAALAAHAKRCQLLGEDECGAEERIEQLEGPAVYVAVRALGDPRSELVDSLRFLLTRVEDLTRLQRFHYYDTGLAWLLILDQTGPTDWKSRIGRETPTSMLQARLGLSGEQLDSAYRAQGNSVFAKAARDAARVRLAAEAALVDSVTAEFQRLPGRLIQISWDDKSGPRNSQFSWKPGARRNVRSWRGGVATEYVVGAEEARYGFADDVASLVIRGPAEWVRDHGQSRVQIRTVEHNPLAHVDGTGIPLNGVNGIKRGALELSVGEFDLFAKSATIETVGNTTRITVSHPD